MTFEPSRRRRERGVRMYRLLLRLFPADMRAAFGEEMVDHFVRRRAEAKGRAVASLWFRAAIDAARHGLGARLDRVPSRRRHTHAVQPAPRWSMESLRYDVRHSARMMMRQPSLTAAILLTLALGVGANTAVFSVVHAVLLRPLPFADPDRLVMIWEKRPFEGVFDNPVSPADYLDWARQATSFTGVAANTTTTTDLTGSGEPVQLRTAGVTSGFFDVLGVRPLHGRTFAPGEDAMGRHRVVVLSFSLWRDRFGSDASIVGRHVQLNGIAHEVIGVLPPDLEGSIGERTSTPGEIAEVWAPLVLNGGPEPPPRAAHFLSVYARLKPGVSVESARAEMDRIGAQLSVDFPNENRNHGAHVVALRERIVAPARTGLLVVMGSVAFLLLIACTNVANLLMARGAGRRREMAIRSAVGAARGRLLRQTLTESLLLAFVGGAVGLLVAWWTIGLLVGATPPALRAAGLERAQLDLPVLGFATALCLLVGFVVGLVPAWRMGAAADAEPLREGGRGPVALRRGIRLALIATEVALTVLLLVGAGLMLRSFGRVLAQPVGFETANRLTATVVLPRSRYGSADAVRRARQSLDERLNGIGGVIAAGASNNLPLSGSDSRQGIIIDGFERRADAPPTRANTRIVTSRYFEATGISVRHGRPFAATDDARAPLVVVINETMARRYWRGGGAVGGRVRFVGDKEPWREVVGVIGDVRHWGLDREVVPELYMPHAQQPSSTLSYVLHTSSDPVAAVAAVKAQVAAVDPDLPLGDVRTMDDVAARSVAARRWSALLLGLLALVGTFLAGAGIYGVMAHVVSLRTSEIGIRMTLGARPLAMLRQVLFEALSQTAVGLFIGLAAAYATAPALESMLYEVRAADPVAFVASAGVVLVVAMLAAAVPALKAMRVDPVQAVRQGAA
jgi:putative ABC transport system permease protein